MFSSEGPVNDPREEELLGATKTLWLQGLMRDHESRLLRYAKRWVAEQTARELVQETFLRLWKEDEDALKGREAEWLFCVCRNLAMDVLEKDKRVGANPVDGENEPASEAENAEEAMGQAQEQSRVLALMKGLPGNQQECLRLKFQEGFSYKEISSITGLSVSHVGVLIHEGMKRLREQLAPAAAGAAVGQGGRQ